MLDPTHFPNPIAFAFQAAGGLGFAAKACGRSYQALNKWRRSASLPRTDYTGETTYAAKLADAASANGNPFDANWLLEVSAPNKIVT